MTSLKSLLNSEGHSNSNTRQRAHYLYSATSATSNSSFLISMITMAKYSAILEPVTNMLQTVFLPDLLSRGVSYIFKGVQLDVSK